MFEPLTDPPDHDGDHAVFLVRDASVLVIADGDTAGFLRSHLGSQPGPVVDALSGAASP